MTTIDSAAQDLSAMYSVPQDNNLTPEEWPVPWTLQVKGQLLDAVKWTATPLDINIVRDRWGVGMCADLTFAWHTDVRSGQQLMDVLAPRLKAVGWTLTSMQTMDDHVVVNLQKSV